MADSTYRPLCLNSDSCKWPEVQVAIYDYVGAVYGEKGKVQFKDPNGGHQLTEQERQYVEEKFGKLAQGSNLDLYISEARKKFFQGLKLPPNSSRCNLDPDLNPTTLFHPQLGSALVLLGRHGCGQKYADQFMRSGLERAIAADPTNWNFFLESYGTDIFYIVDLEEMELFKRMATTLDISLHNPLEYSATSVPVMEEASQSSDYTHEDFMVSFVYSIVADAYTVNPEVDLPFIFLDVIDTYATRLEIEPYDLFVHTRQFLRDFPGMSQQREEANRRATILGDTSNRVNQANLQNQLVMIAKKTPPGKKPHALFVVGSRHLDLIKPSYVFRKKL